MEITIKLTNEESEQYFYNALCNGLSWMLNTSGLVFQYDADEYRKAKEKLKEHCFEDVLMQILRDGGSFIFKDEESDGEMTRTISLKDIHEKVNNTPIKYLLEMKDEEDDANTADAIIQTVIYNEIVFG